MRVKERKRKKSLEASLRTIAIETARAKRLGFNSSYAVLNLALFFLLAERDIQTVKIDALTHPDPWSRSIAARMMLLTIHELDLDKVAGNRLRDAMDRTNVPSSLREEVTEALRQIRKAQDRAKRKFAYLRNATIAHRDADALRQHFDIQELDTLEVVKIAAEFYEGVDKFIEMLPKLVSFFSTPASLVRQLGT